MRLSERERENNIVALLSQLIFLRTVPVRDLNSSNLKYEVRGLGEMF